MSVKSADTIARLVETARDPDAPLGEQHDAFTLLVGRSQHIVFGLALSLLHDVDALARVYGWSEREVLGLSEERRRTYVGMAEP